MKDDNKTDDLDKRLSVHVAVCAERRAALLARMGRAIDEFAALRMHRYASVAGVSLISIHAFQP